MFDSREDNFKSYKSHIDGLQAAAVAKISSPTLRPRPRASNTRTMHGDPVIDVDSISSDSVSTVDGELDGGLNPKDDEAFGRILNGSGSDDSTSEEDDAPPATHQHPPQIIMIHHQMLQTTQQHPL